MESKKQLIIIFIICFSIIGGYFVGYNIGNHNALELQSPNVESAVYDVYGDHNGTITFLKGGRGYAYIDNMQGEFSWDMNDGISYGGLHGTINYWGTDVNTILFPYNLTMVSPDFPNTYAVMRAQ